MANTMRASFVWHLDAVNWLVQCGWVTADGHYAAIEMSLQEFAEKGPAMVEAIQKAVTLAHTLEEMREEGATAGEMDNMLAAIAADGGL